MNVKPRYGEVWDGSPKDLRKECRDNCIYYIKISNREYCGWGIAFKVLAEPDNTLKKCELLHRQEQPGNIGRSINYLNEQKNFGKL